MFSTPSIYDSYVMNSQVLQPPRRKKPTPEVKEPKEPKEVKRFKYARAVEVARDSSSRPILPLTLTDRLKLANLVSDWSIKFGWGL